MVAPAVPCGTEDVNRRLATTALAVALLTSGCGEMQPAEPLAKTVPVALVLFTTTALAVGALVRRTLQGVDPSRRHSALRWPRATAVALLAPVSLGGLVIVVLLSGGVAVGFREAAVSLFTWGDAVVATATAAGVTLLLTALGCAIARGLASTGASRAASLAVLAVVVAFGAVATAGFGLVWLPALLLALVRRERPEEHRTTPPWAVR